MAAAAKCFSILSLAVLTALVSPTVFAASVHTIGLVSNGEGTIGHGAIAPAPAPFDASNTSVQLPSHPAAAYLANIYTLLASRDVFNTVDGSEAPLAAHPAPFAAQGPAGPDLNAIGVSGTVYYSFRGLSLDYLNGNDFNYDLGGNVENRIYRGGEIEFYFDSGSGPTLFARGTDMVLLVSINWNTFAITQTLLSVVSDTSPGMLGILTGSVGISSSPVQQTGTTTEGPPYTGGYGIYNDDGTTWEFDSLQTPVERSSWGAIKRTYSSGTAP